MLSRIKYYDTEREEFITLSNSVEPGSAPYAVDYNRLQRESIWITVNDAGRAVLVYFKAVNQKHREDWYKLAAKTSDFADYLASNWRWVIPLLAKPEVLHQLVENPGQIHGMVKSEKSIQHEVNADLVSRLSFIVSLKDVAPESDRPVSFTLGGGAD